MAGAKKGPELTINTRSVVEKTTAQKRNEIISAVADHVRTAIEVVFGTKENSIGIGKELRDDNKPKIDVANFLEKGTTCIDRSTVGERVPNEMSFVLANTRISQMGRDNIGEQGKEDEGNVDQSSPLDVYMDGVKYLLGELLEEIQLSDFKGYDVKIVASDRPDVDETKPNHARVCKRLSNFIPQAASSKGKE